MTIKEILSLENVKLTKAQKQDLETHRLPRQPGARLKEGNIVSVEGYVDRVECHADSDYHIQVRTKNDGTRCLIAEVPVGDEANKKTVGKLFDKVWKQIRDSFYNGSDPSGKPKANKDHKVRITGQLFYDGHHNQAIDPAGGRGVAPCKAVSHWEIHAITKIELISE